MVDWLVEELRIKGVRQDIGRQWLGNKELLPMLDGLDELESERQESCVQEINRWLQSEYSPLALVVCSRIEEYEKYESRLLLNGAVCLQPLSEEQIRDYLVECDRHSLWVTIKNDDDLLAMVKKPLFLSVVTLADFSVGEWQKLSSFDRRLSYLLDIYVKAMLGREIRNLHYPAEKVPSAKQTIFWLSWLARQMERESQTEFLIEKMQPSWLVAEVSIKDAQTFLTVISFVNRHLYFSMVGLLYLESISTIAKYEGWHFIVHLISFLYFILLLFCGLLPTAYLLYLAGIRNLIFMRFMRFLKALGLESLFPVEFSMNTIHKSSKIKVFHLLKFSHKEVIPSLKKLYKTAKTTVNFVLESLLFTLIISIPLLYTIKYLVNYLTNTNFIKASVKEVIVETIGMQAQIMFLIAVSFLGFHACKTLWNLLRLSIVGVEVETTVKPNQGIWDSLYYWLWLLFCGLISGLGLNFFISFVQRYPKLPIADPFSFLDLTIEMKAFYILALVIFAILIHLFVVPLIYCGIFLRFSIPVIQHFSLRLGLYFKGKIPWNYARFLNYATERMLLQRVGGGYRFLHKYLQEHFARNLPK